VRIEELDLRVDGLRVRSEKEILGMLLDAAKGDERIRAVLLSGSRANPSVPKDQYQDYDVTFYVTDIKPFYNQSDWVINKFGKPLIMQMPEAMRYPSGDGHFNYMMIYADGSRIDLTFEFRKFVDNGEPNIVLLDKDNGNGFIPPLPPPSDAIWHIKPPSPLFYSSCCNNFWWCLNNAAKGIARDELSYVMYMLNEVVRPELHDMMNWYIGVTNGFTLSTGKNGKYFKRYLPPELYEQYVKTYPSAGESNQPSVTEPLASAVGSGVYSGRGVCGFYGGIWASVYTMAGLFHTLALPVADHFGFVYRQDEEDGIIKYLKMVQTNETQTNES